MSKRTLLSFETFEKYEDDGMKHELIQGEHVIAPPATIGQAASTKTFTTRSGPMCGTNSSAESTFRQGSTFLAILLKPDATFIRKSQIERTDPDGYFEGAPALAIEVASESNTAAQLDQKMELYFAHGAEEVWVVFPQTRRVRAHFPDGHSETLTDGLRSTLYPGWPAPLAAIFPLAV